MSELSKKLQRYREERDYYRDKYMKGRERIEQLEAELHDSEGAYKWLKSELRTNAKIIGEQRDTIEQLEAALQAGLTWSESIEQGLFSNVRSDLARVNFHKTAKGLIDCSHLPNLKYLGRESRIPELKQALGERDE